MYVVRFDGLVFTKMQRGDTCLLVLQNHIGSQIHSFIFQMEWLSMQGDISNQNFFFNNWKYKHV